MELQHRTRISRTPVHCKQGSAVSLIKNQKIYSTSASFVSFDRLRQMSFGCYCQLTIRKGVTR
eukprot:jgi/Botrbrau1/20199/Bobra.0409s0001.1